MRKTKYFINQTIGKLIIAGTAMAFGGLGDAQAWTPPTLPPEIPSEVRNVLSSSFPRTELMAGAHARVIVPFWQLESFLEAGVHTRFNEQHLTIEHLHGRALSQTNEWVYTMRDSLFMNNPRFSNVARIKLGTKFRINDRNLIKGVYNIGFAGGASLLDVGFSLGYVRRLNLSPRTKIDLYAKYLRGYRHIGGRAVREFWLGDGYGGEVLGSRSDGTDLFASGNYNGVGAGANLRHRIMDNLNLSLRVGASRTVLSDVIHDEIRATNNVTASIGIEAVLSRERDRIAPRARQTRTTFQAPRPTHRALPCPPGQMRHERSWDRPPSVFNHPTRR